MADANSWDGTQLCSLGRTLEAVGERWTFLILREASAGTTRFSDFRDALGVAPDVLSARLSTLVGAGVMRRETYKEPGRRARDEYVLTESGGKLDLVLAALQQWGDEYLPSSVPTITYRDRNGAPLKVSFVDRDGQPVAQENARAHRPRSEAALRTA